MKYELTLLGDAVMANFATKLGVQQIVNDPAKRQLADEIFDRYAKIKELPEEPRPT